MSNNFQSFPIQQGMNQNLMGSQPYQSQVSQPFFPQPVGNVYSLSTSNDIQNVPTGSNVSIGLCLNENILHIKAFQNGVPMILSYKLSPIEGTGQKENETDQDKINLMLENYGKEIKEIKTQLSQIKEKVGGKVEWQL